MSITFSCKINSKDVNKRTKYRIGNARIVAENMLPQRSTSQILFFISFVRSLSDWMRISDCPSVLRKYTLPLEVQQ